MYKIKTYGPGLYNPPGEKLDIGIDQSYSGFGVTVYGGQESSFSTMVVKFEGKGVDRLEEVYKYLDGLLTDIKKEHQIGEVAMEGYAFGSQMANMLGELGGVVKLVLKRHGVYPLIIPPTIIKKYVTGKGTGIQKNQMLLHVYKKWGVEFTDDNACDSFALARIASGLGDLAYEVEILEKLKDPKYRQ